MSDIFKSAEYARKKLQDITKTESSWIECDTCCGEGKVMVGCGDGGYHHEKWVDCPDCNGIGEYDENKT